MAALRKSRKQGNKGPVANVLANPEFLGEGDTVLGNNEGITHSYTDEELEKQIVHDEGDSEPVNTEAANDLPYEGGTDEEDLPIIAAQEPVKMPDMLSDAEFKWDIPELNET